MKFHDLLRAAIGFAGILLIFANAHNSTSTVVAEHEDKSTTSEVTSEITPETTPEISHSLQRVDLLFFSRKIRAIKSKHTDNNVVDVISEPLIEIEEPTEEPIEEIKETYRFMATGYSSAWEENGGYGAVDCKYGQPLPANAIAADLSILPYGTKVYIEGFGEKIVVDTASKATITRTQAMADQRDCTGWIDIYFGDDRQQASDWGVQVVTLEIIEWGDGR